MQFSDKTTFEAYLLLYKPTGSLHVIEIEVKPKYTKKLNRKVLDKVKIQLLGLGIGEWAESSSIKKQIIAYPKTLTEKLAAKHTQSV